VSLRAGTQDATLWDRWSFCNSRRESGVTPSESARFWTCIVCRVTSLSIITHKTSVAGLPPRESELRECTGGATLTAVG
jgi:hypothetical protein